jgi:hypothetical protein
VLSLDPDIIILDIGINDITQEIYPDSASMIADYDRQLKLLRAAGKHVIAMAIQQTLSTPIGSDANQIRLDVNEWLADEYENERSGFVFVDQTLTIVGSPSPYLISDGTHPNELGGYVVANDYLLPVLRTMISPGNYYDTDPTHENVMPDRGMLGTTGTKGTGVTGNVATNYNVTRTGASTIVASKEIINGSFEKQVFTITPISDASTIHQIRVQKTATTTLASMGLEPGDWVQQYLYVELSAWDYWSRAQTALIVGTSTTTTFTAYSMRYTAPTPNVLPSGGVAGWWISDPFQIPDDSTHARLNQVGSVINVFWFSPSTGTGVIKISQPIIRKMDDPRPLWNL